MLDNGLFIQFKVQMTLVLFQTNTATKHTTMGVPPSLGHLPTDVPMM